MPTLCKRTLYTVLFLNEWKRKVVIEPTQFLSSVFLLENIYSGVNFFRKNVCGNFYLWELVFANHCNNIANITKIRTRKNSVPHGITLLNFSPFNLPLLSSPAHPYHLLLTAGESASLEWQGSVQVPEDLCPLWQHTGIITISSCYPSVNCCTHPPQANVGDLHALSVLGVGH